MNYEETLTYLFSLRRFGIKPGLENIKALLEYSGNPQSKYKIIHVAGTNGKGSTSSLIASIIRQYGYKVGLYTSPHLSRFNERIVINGNQIEDDFIVEKVKYFQPLIEKNNLTFFDLTTAIAFIYFAEKKVDYAVIETGLGGRLDSTNIVEPELSVITSVGLDHKNILGNSIEAITSEKAGIIKKGIPVIISPNENVVNNILINKANECGSGYILVKDKYKINNIRKDYPKMVMEINSLITGITYQINSPLFGNYQLNNISTALASAEIIFGKISDKKKTESGIENLMNNFPLMGRFQQISENPLIILDTAHNSPAILNLLEEFKTINKKRRYALFALMKDKDISDIKDLITNSFNEFYVTGLNFERAMSSVELFNFFNKKNVFERKNVYICLNEIMDKLNKDDGLLIFGSNYLAGEVLDYYGINKLSKQQII